MTPIFDHQHLALFIGLANHLNMRRAARDLQLTPSGVSRRLATLERSWGCRLFDRTPQRLTLTAAGRELLPIAEAALERLGNLRTQLETSRTLQATKSPPLRIGATAALGQIVLPAVLREFSALCPEIAVHLAFGAEPHLAQSLSASQIDLALSLEPPGVNGLHFERVAEDELVFVLHPLHPWAVARRVDPHDSRRRKLIVATDAPDARERILQHLRAEGFALTPEIETNDEIAARELVRLDLGVGILPPWAVAAEIARGELTTLPLGRHHLRRTWGLLSRGTRPLDLPQHLFAQICGAALRERLA